MTDTLNAWADGWSFYKSAGAGEVPSEDDPDLLE